MSGLDAIKRPNGRMYRPQKIIAKAVCSGDDQMSGVVVFGTHDVERAEKIAQDYVTWQIDSGYKPASPVPVWWRESYAYGEPTFAIDEHRGRAGVYFSDIVERADNNYSVKLDQDSE